MTQSIGATSSPARILTAARALFQREGIQAVGVDRIVLESGIAKTTLYRWFRSKDALIAAVLEEEARERWQAWDRNALHFAAAPLEELRGIFRNIARRTAAAGYRGCPFLNAAAELADPSHPAREVCRRAQQELRGRLHGLAERLGATDPDLLADQLLLLAQGGFAAGVATQGQGPAVPGPARALLRTAEMLVHAHSPTAGPANV